MGKDQLFEIGNEFSKFSFKLTDECNPIEIGRVLLKSNISKVLIISDNHDPEFADYILNYYKEKEKFELLLKRFEIFEGEKTFTKLCKHCINDREFLGIVLRSLSKNLFKKSKSEIKSDNDEDLKEDIALRIDELDKIIYEQCSYELYLSTIEKNTLTYNYIQDIPYVRLGLQPIKCKLSNGDNLIIDIDLVIHRSGMCILTFNIPIKNKTCEQLLEYKNGELKNFQRFNLLRS